MGLVLKSNGAMVLKKLTDLGLSGVTAHLDFRDYTYKQGNTIVDLATLLVCTRSTLGGLVNAYSEYSEVTANTPRISYDLSTNKKGLFVEAAFTNSFKNSFVPVSQSIVTTLSAGTAVIVDVVGTGTAKIYQSGNLMGAATSNSSFIYHPTSTGSATFDIVIDGSLTYCAFYQTISASKRITRAKTTTANVTVNSDVLELIPAKITELFGTDKTGCIVLRHFTPNNLFDRTKTSAQTNPILQFVQDTDISTGIFVNRQENGTLGNFMRIKNPLQEIVSSATLNLSQNSIYAINVSPTSAQFAVNGILGGVLNFSSIDLNRLCIGSGLSYSTNNNQYIEEILFFDRILTTDELKTISSL